MTNILRQACAFILAAVFLLSPNAYSSDIAVDRIQKAYEGIKDMKGSFVQKSHIKDLKRTDSFKGTFMIKMPSMMRWHYQGDNKHNTEVIINNDEMIVHQKNEKQAFKSRFNRDTYGQAPIALLSGFADIEKEFEVVKSGDKLLLKPKKSASSMTSIEITASGEGFPISSLTIVDKRSNRIEITLKDIVLNTGIKDSVFDFSLPKGVSMYEHKSQ
jgi:outer membrane lipoprotein carrier protein